MTCNLNCAANTNTLLVFYKLKTYQYPVILNVFDVILHKFCQHCLLHTAFRGCTCYMSKCICV